MKVSLLNRTDTALLIIDAQEKLFSVMSQRQRVTDNMVRLLKLAELFELPVIWTEQYPRWLGPTILEVKERLPEGAPIEKMDFNCCAVDEFNNVLESRGRRQVIALGCETHICVFQTCFSLLERGCEVHVPMDAVDSRTQENWKVGLELMKGAGATITSTETVIYQLLEKAGTKQFKEMLKLVK